MSDITTFAQATMSSREIADLTGKRHSDVKRDIDRMASALEEDVRTFAHIYLDAQNREQVEYRLDRYHTEVLVTGYDVKRRAAVIRRWYDLETQADRPALPNFNNPVEAARAWADVKESEQKALAIAEAARPAVEFVDSYVHSDSGSKGFRQVAKLLQANERKFRDFLKDEKVLYKLGGEWMPYQQHIEAGRFEVKTGVSDEGAHVFNQAKFTAKGINWIAGKWAQHQLPG